MAGTVTTQLTNITLAETGDSANWDDIGGGPGSVQDDGAPVQGAQVRGRRIDNITTRGFGFDNGTAIDLSGGEHVAFWINVLQPTLIASFIELSISDSATDCQSGNWNGYQFPAASYPFQGGWIRVWVDPSLTRDAGSGTLNLATGPRNFGARFPMGDVGGTTPNCQLDRIDYATAGVLIDAGTGGSPATFDDIVSDDQGNTSNRYGVIIRVNGKDFVTARILIADATATVFNDTPNIIFTDQPFAASDWLGITVDLQNASTDIDFVAGAIETAPGATNLGDLIVTGTSGAFNWEGGTANDLRIVTLTSACVVDGTSFSRCGLITAAGASMNNCVVSNSTASASILWNVATDTDGLLDGITVTSDGSNHAIELGPNTPSEITLNNWTHSAYASSNGSTGNEVIYNNSGKALTINVSGFSSTPSVRNGAGASTTLVEDPATLTVTVTDQDTKTAIEKARVLVWCSGTGSFPSDDSVTLSVSGSTVTVTHTGHGLSTGNKVKIDAPGRRNLSGVWTITVTGANTYTYTLPEADARLEVATGQVTSPASTGKIYYDLGFRPMGMRIRAIEATGTTLHDGAVHMEGYSDGVNQVVMGSRRHGTTTGGTRQGNPGKFIELQEHSSTVDQVEAEVEFDDEGFWIDWTLTASGYIFQYEAFGGFGVEAHVGRIDMNNASPAVYDEMDFAPNLIFGCNILVDGQDIPWSDSNPRFGSGVCDGDLNQYGWGAHWGNFGGTTSQYRTWTNNGMFVGQNQTATYAVYKVTSINQDGFTMEKDSGTNETAAMYFLALKIPSVVVGTTTKSTGGAPATQTLPSFGFTPQMYGLLTAAVTTETSTQDVSFTEGVYDGTNQGTLATSSDDGANDAQSIQNATEILHVLSNTGTSLAQAVAQTITDDTPDIVWNPNDANAYNIGYWAVGDVAPGSPVASLVLIDGYTDASGVISDTRTYSTNQGIAGYARKGTSSPVYVTGNISGTVNATAGLPVNIGLVRDE